MRSVRVLPLALLALAMALPLGVTAQGHEHGAVGPILLAHDGPADGRQFVGNLAHFAAIAHGDDAVPDFHQDVPMRVSLDGQVLFETTAASGHDYDGINVLDVVFPHAGTYLIEALGADGKAVATFGGEVVDAGAAAVPVAIDFTASTGEPAAHELVDFTFGVVREDGSLVPHTDCWFEVAAAERLAFRAKAHTHEEMQQVAYAFPDGGSYDVRVLCFQAYPSAKATLFAPLLHTQRFTVSAGVPRNTVYEAIAPPTGQNAVVQGQAGGELLLVGTFDPYTVVGPDTLQHLVVAAVDPMTGQPRQHVDFTAVAWGPEILFVSDTLHEYDGLFEVSMRQALPGAYTLLVTASSGEWSDSVQMTYVVAAPVVPTSAGLVGYTLDGAPAPAGQATDYRFAATATSGAFAHSEVELNVLGDGPVPLLRAKLHTHDDGSFPFRLALPAGRATLGVDGFPLMPEAVLVSPAAFTLDVPAGDPVPATPSDEDAQALPAPGLALVGLALAALALARRRA